MQGRLVAHESSEPIYDAARLCSKYFEHSLETVSLAEDTHLEIEELWVKFNQWAAYAGAFATPKSSLDTRLEPYDDIRDMVLELLYMIQANLAIVKVRDNTEPVEESSPGLSAASAALHRLLILSRRLRNPTRLNDGFKQVKRTSSQEESMCRLLVQRKYPNAPSSLWSQLGVSIQTRGIALQYKQRHNQKLSYRRDTQCESWSLEDENEGPKEQVKVPITSPNGEALLKKHKHVQGPETTPSGVSPFVASHIRRSSRKPTGSVVSSGSVVQDGQSNEDNYPPPPKALQPCAICSMPLLPSDLEKHAWRTHVDHDVEPYVCVSEECSEPLQYFNSLQDWMDHMQRRHSFEWSDRIHTERWYCDLDHDEPTGVPPEFDDKAAFMGHLNKCHGDQLTRSQIMGRLRRNRRIATRDPFVCPLCDCVPPDVDKRRGEKPYELLWKHIAQHLKWVAFHSLSYLGGGGDPGDMESIEDSSTKASEKCVSRHSLSDDGSSVLYCDGDSCDCKGQEKNSTADWSTLESAFGSILDIPEDQRPTSHDDPKYTVTPGTQSEWEFWHPLSLPPEYKPLGLEYQGHTKDEKLMEYFGRQVRLTNDDYTIAWMCETETEYVAAQMFFDDKHHPLASQDADDHNSYTLGRINGHNVVIARLASRDHGPGSTAKLTNCPVDSVAKPIKTMLQTFTNVRIGLRVGVGSGVPTLRDIHLGDVVVSVPDYYTPYSRGAVFQFDLGQSIQNKKFKGLKYLGTPPNSLLAHAQNLKVKYQMGGNQIKKTIRDILEQAQDPRLQKEYQMPDPATDRLYRRDHPHTGSHQDCASACGLDKANIVSRKPRSEYGDNPKVHYGVIASSTVRMKDATLRDRLAREEEVLCFEVAELVNCYNCLTIRGIYHYSDSHENTVWKGYAAMTAAAYTKDLLNMIRPYEVLQAGTKLSEVFDRSQKAPRGSDIKAIYLDKLLRWLSPPDPSVNYHKAREKHHPGTGEWFLESDAYLRWTETGSFLWLRGDPGSGKTVLSSTVIANLEEVLTPSQTLLYFDFSDPYKRYLRTAIRSLMAQLYLKKQGTRQYLDSLYYSFNDGMEQPSHHSLLPLFQKMVQEAGEVLIVLDAIDIVDPDQQQSTPPAWIKTLRDSAPNIHILVTSQPGPYIESNLSWVVKKDILDLDGATMREDIGKYVNMRIAQMPKWQSEPEIQEMIRVALMRKAKGRFRLVVGLLFRAEKCETPRQLQHVLSGKRPDSHRTGNQKETT